MLFNSIGFFWFMLIVVPVFYLLPQRFRWAFMLIASYYFYIQWNVKYTVLIVLTTVVDYLVGLWIGAAKTRGIKNAALICCLFTNLGLLFVFKYFNFAVAIINSLNARLGIDMTLTGHSLLLPVGISFYIFQSLGYVLDVYMGKREPEKHFGIFALFVSFFPQLVAGPIERSTHLMPQFREVKKFSWTNFNSGFQLILTGLIKKVVIADRLAILVNVVYGDVHAHNGAELALGTLFFAIQIYCDFSGYTDIAIGSARILGFDLMQNFNRPYLSRSVGEFWQRWHISLTTWFKDYVYIPLGGNRRGVCRTAFNLTIVFLISGIWHGASFNFVIWGLMNGVYLLIERYWLNAQYAKLESHYPNSRGIAFLRTAFTFTLIFFSWVFFRAATLADALFTVKAILTAVPFARIFELGLNPAEFLIASLSIMVLLGLEYAQQLRQPVGEVRKEPFFARVSACYVMIFIIIILGVYGDYDKAQFIYFAF